jgi:hypothetical protein
MFDRLIARAEEIAGRAALRNIDRLQKRGTPADVAITSDESTIRIAGKRLRLRMIENPWLRNFWR